MWNLCSSLSWLDTSVRSKSDENYKDICHKEVYTQNIDIIHVQIGSEHNCKDLCESFQEKRQKKITLIFYILCTSTLISKIATQYT